MPAADEVLECLHAKDGAWWEVHSAQVYKPADSEPFLKVLYEVDATTEVVQLGQMPLKLRRAGVQVQDSDCARLRPGDKVTVFLKPRQAYYNGVIKDVMRATHGSNEDDCTCRFTIQWSAPARALLEERGAAATPTGTYSTRLADLCTLPGKVQQHRQYARWHAELTRAVEAWQRQRPQAQRGAQRAGPEAARAPPDAGVGGAGPSRTTPRAGSRLATPATGTKSAAHALERMAAGSGDDSSGGSGGSLDSSAAADVLRRASARHAGTPGRTRPHQAGSPAAGKSGSHATGKAGQGVAATSNQPPSGQQQQPAQKAGDAARTSPRLSRDLAATAPPANGAAAPAAKKAVPATKPAPPAPAPAPARAGLGQQAGQGAGDAAKPKVQLPAAPEHKLAPGRAAAAPAAALVTHLPGPAAASAAGIASFDFTRGAPAVRPPAPQQGQVQAARQGSQQAPVAADAEAGPGGQSGAAAAATAPAAAASVPRDELGRSEVAGLRVCMPSSMTLGEMAALAGLYAVGGLALSEDTRTALVRAAQGTGLLALGADRHRHALITAIADQLGVPLDDPAAPGPATSSRRPLQQRPGRQGGDTADQLAAELLGGGGPQQPLLGAHHTQVTQLIARLAADPAALPGAPAPPERTSPGAHKQQAVARKPLALMHAGRASTPGPAAAGTATGKRPTSAAGAAGSVGEAAGAAPGESDSSASHGAPQRSAPGQRTGQGNSGRPSKRQKNGSAG